jgi:outer membrane protein OmpU
MNKLTKIGASALCGSLAAISAANAGEMTVTGGVDMSWISLDDTTTGNPIGLGSNLTFSGSGELDNGWGVALSVAMANQDAYSNTNVTVTIPSLGDIRIDQGTSGTGIDRIDDVTPNVWEEAYGTGLSTGIDTVTGTSAGSTIEYTAASDLFGDGVTFRAAYSPKVGGSNAGDKAGSGVSTSVAESGFDLTLQLSEAVTGVEGLTIYTGYSEVTQDTTNSSTDGDKEEKTIAATYSVGSVTLGYQWSKEELGRSAGVDYYENDGYGITYLINDDLSVGWNHYESSQENITAADVTAEATSLQIAYTMGGASIRLAEASSKNNVYSTAAGKDRDATTLSVSLAF